ncbi:MAG: ABC transporter substrate-binding protein [Desulfobacterales bacterium]|nr:ABC transporter substrate-binding protein [Desulfobacterales bacterium]
MRRKVYRILVWIFVLSFIVTFAPSAFAGKDVVKIGFNAPLSGPAAAWGLPGMEGVSIWVDKVNDSGGLEVGGKTYMVEIVQFDNEGVGSKALLGARKLVLEDKVEAMLMLGGAPSAVVQPFLTKHKIMTFVLVSSDIAPDRPYLLDVTDNFPTYHLLHAEYIAKAHPEAKRVAIISQDDEIGLNAIAWSEAGFKAAGIEVVYSKPFGLETTDFAPIVTAALAKNPDIISTGAAYPEFQALIFEQAHSQGWKGVVTSACWDFKAITAKVPTNWMDGAVSGFPDFDDPKLSSEHNEFWKAWKEKYPTHSFSEITWEYKAALDVWAYGAKKAGSVKSEDVYKALKSSDTVPHAFGDGVWWGEEIYGLDNLLVPTWPITEVKDSKPVIVDYGSLTDWLKDENKKKILMESLEKWNMNTVKK